MPASLHALIIDLEGWLGTLATRLLIASAVVALVLVLQVLIAPWLLSRRDRRAPSATRRHALTGVSAVLGGMGVLGVAAATLAGLGLRFSVLSGTAAVIVAAGIAAGPSWRDLVAGISLRLEDTIGIGDVIALGAHEGRLVHWGWRSVSLETASGAEVVLANHALAEGPLTVLARTPAGARAAPVRVVLDIAVGAGADPMTVTGLLLTIARAHPKILADPTPKVAIAAGTDAGLGFTITGHVAEVADVTSTATMLRGAVHSACAAAGIPMQRAQHDIHLRDLDTVRRVVTAALEERQRQRAAAAATPGGGASG